MELIMFGVTLTVSMVVASLLVFVITMKVMCSKKFWNKFMKNYMQMIAEFTKEMEELDL